MRNSSPHSHLNCASSEMKKIHSFLRVLIIYVVKQLTVQRKVIQIFKMNKIIDFGRKAMFYVRVLSGYEERRIRSYRLQLQQRLQRAQERKEALKNVPEQIILSEVRRMVEDMQALNKKLEETEAAIEDYFKPIDKQADIIMKMQLEGEERKMKDMMSAMQQQALLEKAEAEKTADVQNADIKQQMEERDCRKNQSHAEMR